MSVIAEVLPYPPSTHSTPLPPITQVPVPPSTHPSPPRTEMSNGKHPMLISALPVPKRPNDLHVWRKDKGKAKLGVCLSRRLKRKKNKQTLKLQAASLGIHSRLRPPFPANAPSSDRHDPPQYQFCCPKRSNAWLTVPLVVEMLQEVSCCKNVYSGLGVNLTN